MKIDPYTLIGKQVPAGDGEDYGCLVVDYDEAANDLMVIPIIWSTGAACRPGLTEARRLDVFKASYRYQLSKAR